jgi:hypothetical protein
MGKKLNLLSGMGLGAVLAFLMDPDRGRRRRALVRDKAVHFWRRANLEAGRVSRDLGNRVRGVTAETVSRFGTHEVLDDVLVERVRSAIGHVVSQPGAIEVTASAGLVTLRGPVLVWEVDSLLARVRAIRGVKEVEDMLEMHESAGEVPGQPEEAADSGESM